VPKARYERFQNVDDKAPSQLSSFPTALPDRRSPGERRHPPGSRGNPVFPDVDPLFPEQASGAVHGLGEGRAYGGTRAGAGFAGIARRRACRAASLPSPTQRRVRKPDSRGRSPTPAGAAVVSGPLRPSAATLDLLRAPGLEFLLKPVLPEEFKAVSHRLVAAARDTRCGDCSRTDASKRCRAVVVQPIPKKSAPRGALGGQTEFGMTG